MLRFEHVTFRYPNHVEPVIEDLCVDIVEGDRIAIIGKNGCGKTTFANLILGRLHPSEGRIHVPKDKPVIGYLPQHFDADFEGTVLEICHGAFPELRSIGKQLKSLEQRISREPDNPDIQQEYGTLLDRYTRDGGWEIDARCARALAETGLDESFLQREYDTLSGGEKTRVAIAGLLVKAPDILLLDEPTNHLDLEMVEWLERFIKRFSGTVIAISHDRAFIDNIAERLIAFEREGVLMRRGNYSLYRDERQYEKEHQMEQWSERQKKMRQLHDAALKRKQWAQKFQPETRSEGGGAIYESIVNPAKTQMQQAKHILERMKMLEERYPIEKPWIEKKRHIHFDIAQPPSNVIFGVVGVSHRFGEKQVFNDLSLHIYRGEHVHLKGPNGSGKTTLLRMLNGDLSQDQGDISRSGRLKIGYYDQEHRQLDRDAIVIDFLMRHNEDAVFVRTMMGCLNIGDDIVNRPIGSLSVGERSKVALGTLLVTRCNVLLLDEPTNHLDLATRELLEEALRDFPGTILFVSHDRWFIDKLATGTIELR